MLIKVSLGIIPSFSEITLPLHEKIIISHLLIYQKHPIPKTPFISEVQPNEKIVTMEVVLGQFIICLLAIEMRDRPRTWTPPHDSSHHQVWFVKLPITPESIFHLVGPEKLLNIAHN